MKDRIMIRVAISNWSSQCDECGAWAPIGQGDPIEGDYCPSCQYAYASATEVREYADQTVEWFPNTDKGGRQADKLVASLKPFTY